MNTDADFFLSSSESYAFRGPYKCWIEASVIGELRKDYLLVRIAPPAIDYKTKEPLEKILVVGRTKPTNLRELPANVYIAKIKDKSVLVNHRCDASSIEIVASGDIFSTFEKALEFAKTIE